MDPYSSRLFLLLNNLKEAKIIFYLLIVVFVFDYLLFPAPILAAENEIKTGQKPVIKNYYLVSSERIENGDFFIITGVEKDETIIIDENKNDQTDTEIKKSEEKPKASTTPKRLPANGDKKTVPGGMTVVTAYNSEVSQCDASPCTTANGFNVCKHGIEDTVAANHLPFGTKIKIPALFGDRIFVVRDRMNKRHYGKIDVWMKNKTDARQFGVRTAQVEIVK